MLSSSGGSGQEAKATLAQLAERLTRNEKVDSSILSSGSFTSSFGPVRYVVRASGVMVAAQDLGSCVFGRVGSSPISRTGFTGKVRSPHANFMR